MLLQQAISRSEELEAQGDLAGAEAQLQDAVRAYPDDERPGLKLAWFLHRRGRREAAGDLFEKTLLQGLPMLDKGLHGGSFDQACTNIFAFRSQDDAVRAVKALCAKDVALNGEQAWTELYHGALAFLDDDETGTARHLSRCLALGDSPLANTFGSFTYKDDAFVASLGSERPGNTDFQIDAQSSALVHRPREGDAVVHAMSCDGFYFSQFGPKIAASLDAKGGSRTLFHIHVMNAEDSTESLLAEIRAAHPELRLNVTSSRVEFDPQTTKMNRKAFFTCGRFLIAPDLMRIYGLPVLVTEFDAELARDPALHADALADVDVGLSFYTSQDYFPWNRVWAGTVFGNTTEAGRRFLQLTADFCAAFLAAPKVRDHLWHVDQNALHCVHRFMMRAEKPPVVQDIKTTLPSLLNHKGGIY